MWIATILYGLTFISFQVFSGNPATIYILDAFSQPAVLFLDVFLYSFIGDFTFKYAKLFMLGRFVFIVTVLSIALLDVFSSVCVEQLYKLNPGLMSLFYALFFIVLIMLPALETFLKREFPETAGGNKKLMPYRFAILKRYKLELQNSGEYLSEKARMFSKQAHLTQREEQVLGLLLEKQDNDVITGLLGISKNTLKTHLKNIYSKLEIKSREELYELAKIAGGQGGRLTGREKQILESLLRGKSADEIAAQFFISRKTVSVHIWNICNKYGVKNAQDLKDTALWK